MAVIDMDYALGGGSTETLLYSANTYSETVNLSKSYKNFKYVLIMWVIAAISKSDYFLTTELDVNDHVGTDYTGASSNYFIYGEIISNTQIKIKARDSSGGNAYIKAIYGIN